MTAERVDVGISMDNRVHFMILITIRIQFPGLWVGESGDIPKYYNTNFNINPGASQTTEIIAVINFPLILASVPYPIPIQLNDGLLRGSENQQDVRVPGQGLGNY